MSQTIYPLTDKNVSRWLRSLLQVIQSQKIEWLEDSAHTSSDAEHDRMSLETALKFLIDQSFSAEVHQHMTPDLTDRPVAQIIQYIRARFIDMSPARQAELKEIARHITLHTRRNLSEYIVKHRRPRQEMLDDDCPGIK